MSEYAQQIMFSSQIVWLAIFSWFYGRGGISGKWIRRFIGTAWMTLGIVVFSLWQETFHWVYLTFYPLAISGCIIGYGKGDLGVRMLRRLGQGLAFGLSPIALVIYNHAWGAGAFNVGLCVTTCLVVGGLNVFGNARKNETVISTLCFSLVLFLVSKP